MQKVLVVTVIAVLAVSFVLPAQAPPAPAEYQVLEQELFDNLANFDAVLDSSWDQSRYPVAFSGQLKSAHANSGTGLLSPGSFDGVLLDLDGLQALGVKAISLTINFPILYRPFHSSDEVYGQYLDFYRNVAQAVRSRGLKLIVKSEVIFAGSGGAWNVRGYYESLTLEQYRAGRAETARVIAQELQPDYLSVSTEPDTEAAQTGKAELATLEGSVTLLREILDALHNAGVEGVKVGAGVGTWLPSYKAFIQEFGLSDLDFIDIHVYPTSRSFLDRAIEIAQLARTYGKTVAMTETWAYKLRDAELGKLGYRTTLARNSFSFWAPVDRQHIQTMVKFAHAQQLEFFAPFCTEYFRAYLNYDETTKDLPPAALDAAGSIAHTQAIVEARITSTGLAYHDAILDSPDFDPPASPANVVATTVSDSRIAIEWGPATDNVGVLGYVLSRDGVGIYRGAKRFFFDEGLDDGVTYTYTVAAFDGPGHVSPPSAAAEATTIDMTPPSTPTGVTAVAMSETQVDLSWTPSEDNAAVKNYVIYRGVKATEMIPVAMVEEPAYSDSNLWADTMLYYAVEAFDQTGHRSSRSAAVAVRTKCDTTSPAPPQNLTVRAVSDRQIDLSWSASTDNLCVHGYKIYRGLAPESLVLVGYTRNLAASQASLAPSKTYYYAVSAIDTSGNESQRTPVAAATTEASADVSPPYVVVSRPIAGAVVRRTVVLGAYAADYRHELYDTPSGVASVQFQIDGVNFGPSLTGSPYTVSLDTTQLSNGTHLVTATATDHAGLIATSPAVAITVSN